MKCDSPTQADKIRTYENAQSLYTITIRKLIGSIVVPTLIAAQNILYNSDKVTHWPICRNTTSQMRY